MPWPSGRAHVMLAHFCGLPCKPDADKCIRVHVSASIRFDLIPHFSFLETTSRSAQLHSTIWSKAWSKDSTNTSRLGIFSERTDFNRAFCRMACVYTCLWSPFFPQTANFSVFKFDLSVYQTSSMVSGTVCDHVYVCDCFMKELHGSWGQ